MTTSPGGQLSPLPLEPENVMRFVVRRCRSIGPETAG